MKRNISIFFFLLLLLALACTQRKSAEEAERFLQAAIRQQKETHTPEEQEITSAKLFNAEQEYNFTPAQLLQFKRLLLKQSYRFDRELLYKFGDEAEAIALQTGNDSLLCATRWDIFRCLQTMHDTTTAFNLLQRQAPLVRTLYGEEELKPYYYAIANMYNYHNQPSACFHWLRKARPERTSQLNTWYNQMANALIRFDRYSEALEYADSSLTATGKNKPGASASCLIKGQALRYLGRTDEALQCYQETVASIDSLSLTRKMNRYSYNELYIFYNYASLLQQAKRYNEAIPLLDRVTRADKSVNKYKTHYSYYTNDIENPPINASRLLAQCYYGIGQKDQYLQYAHRADSLQDATNEVRRKINEQRMEEIYRNKLLNNQLLHQVKETIYARRMQYTLLALVVLLTGILIYAIIWWHDRRNRLRNLFILITERHADWLEIQSLLIENNPMTVNRQIAPGNNAPFLLEPHPIPEDTEILHVNRRIYHRVLQVMEAHKPFLDPKLDLIALARMAGTNRTQLSVAINQQSQTSFSKWLAAYRVNYLIEQIDLNPDQYIDQLYSSAGFASRTTFYRQFHQITGLTPKQYMKEKEL